MLIYLHTGHEECQKQSEEANQELGEGEREADRAGSNSTEVPERDYRDGKETQDP